MLFLDGMGDGFGVRGALYIGVLANLYLVANFLVPTPVDDAKVIRRKRMGAHFEKTRLLVLRLFLFVLIAFAFQLALIASVANSWQTLCAHTLLVVFYLISNGKE